LIGHGAASGETPALILDYIHNLVAAVWIGGIFYFVFTLLPTLSKLKEINKEKMSLALIPRFSIAFIISIGIVIITGPTLMWFLESDVGLITDSLYGQLIMLKIAIAAVMISLGGFFQFRVQKNAAIAIFNIINCP
jgi:copper transport protein